MILDGIERESVGTMARLTMMAQVMGDVDVGPNITDCEADAQALATRIASAVPRYQYII